MRDTESPLTKLRARLATGTSPQAVAVEALARSNSNFSRNVYLAQNTTDLAAQAIRLEALDPATRPALYSIPISLKDCFDLEGYITTCGARFYGDPRSAAAEDSWLAAQLRRTGALIPGKTHMHQLAYGITGQNADFGDCLQPNNPPLLTGGSSSGAAASVQEGSALAAIGTDTGGSIRVPAALCGLAGYRASHGIGDWRAAVPLAPSFDTMGLLFSDLRDGPALAQALFNLLPSATVLTRPKIAIVPTSFLQDCEAEILTAYTAQQHTLTEAGGRLHEIDVSFWADSLEIFAPIQAYEAARIQRRKLSSLGQPDFSVFESGIAERLTWGESISVEELTILRRRHIAFRAVMDQILTDRDLLLMPCAPMRQLRATDDHTETRRNILRYTTPASLAGMPAVTIPQVGGAGMQLIAARNRDADLLNYTANLA